MGIGKSGEPVDSKKLRIKLGEFVVAENGKISDSYNEEKLKEFFEDSDMPSLPFFNLDTEEGLLDRLDYDFGYVGGVGKRGVYRTH